MDAEKEFIEKYVEEFCDNGWVKIFVALEDVEDYCKLLLKLALR